MRTSANLLGQAPYHSTAPETTPLRPRHDSTTLTSSAIRPSAIKLSTHNSPDVACHRGPFETWQGHSKSLKARFMPTPKPLVTYLESDRPSLPPTDDLLSAGGYEDEFEEDDAAPRASSDFFDLPLENPIISETQIEFCFVGGGPACFSALASMVKHNQLHELMEGRGFAIIERTSSFASGNLGEYGIRSNTSINSFLKTIVKLDDPMAAGSKTVKPSSSKKKIAKTNLSDIYTGQHTETTEVHTIFRKLWNSSLVEYMRDPSVRSKIISLPIIAVFLCCAGNTLLQYIYSVFKRRVFFPFHEVMKIEDLVEGKKVRIVAKDIRKNKLKIFISKVCALGTGAKPSNPPEYIEHAAKSKKIFPADDVLRYDGFMELLNSIRDVPNFKTNYKAVNPFQDPHSPTVPKEGVFKRSVVRTLSGEKVPPKITIIGGAHSAFSVAWLLLNGPPDQIHSHIKLPARKWIKSCKTCCQCGAAEQKAACKCQCSCLGGLYDLSDWIVNQGACRNLQLPSFEPGCIRIIHRHPIRVYYRTMAEARADGYVKEKAPETTSKLKQELKGELAGKVKKENKLYEFSGLRGDAKDLFRAIKDGREKRIQLIQTESQQEVAKLVDESNAVVWAGGYSSNNDIMFTQVARVPDPAKPQSRITQQSDLLLSKNTKDSRVQVQYGKGKASKLLQKGGTVLDRLYGIGIGFPIRLTEHFSKFFVKQVYFYISADGIGFYVNNIQEKLVKHILPYKSHLPTLRALLAASQPPTLKPKAYPQDQQKQSISFEAAETPQILSPTKQHLLKKRALVLERKYKKEQKAESDVEVLKHGLTRRSQGLQGSRPGSRNSITIHRKKSQLKKTPKFQKSPTKPSNTVLDFKPDMVLAKSGENNNCNSNEGGQQLRSLNTVMEVMSGSNLLQARGTKGFSSSINIILDRKPKDSQSRESKQRKKKPASKSRAQRGQVLSSDMQYRMYLDQVEGRSGLNHSSLLDSMEGNHTPNAAAARLGNLYKNRRVLSPIKLIKKGKKAAAVQKESQDDSRPVKMKSVQLYNPQAEVSRCYYYSSSNISPIAARIISQSKQQKQQQQNLQFVHSFHDLSQQQFSETDKGDAFLPALHH